jgi:glycosyltransferase involved in cell wall biosynthesis
MRGQAHASPPRPIKVFVHLPYDVDAANWTAEFQRGLAPDKSPYGYHHAESLGCQLHWSQDFDETALEYHLRRKIRSYLGFDFVHAWRNRRPILASDVVWTHSESEHLAVSLLFLGVANRPRPRLIAQSVWLFDCWSNLPGPRKQLYRFLMRQADVLTVLSSHNLQVARQVLPDLRSEMVPFGISLESFPMQPPVMADVGAGSIRVFSPGNDKHRDWLTLVNAIGEDPAIEARVASSYFPDHLRRRSSRFLIEAASRLPDIRRLYRWADIVVVPLKHNLHASGLTVVLEATACGVPVICSDTGGLRDYFADSEVVYVRSGDPGALHAAIRAIGSDPAYGFERVKRAQKKMLDRAFTSTAYARRHVMLSRQIILHSRITTNVTGGSTCSQVDAPVSESTRARWPLQ